MIAWGIAWTNAKIVGEYLSFYNLVFFRFLLGFLSLLPFIIMKKNISEDKGSKIYSNSESAFFLI